MITTVRQSLLETCSKPNSASAPKPTVIQRVAHLMRIKSVRTITVKLLVTKVLENLKMSARTVSANHQEMDLRATSPMKWHQHQNAKTATVTGPSGAAGPTVLAAQFPTASKFA